MKHRAMTPLRWIGRLPGRIYRNKLLRVFVGGMVAYEIAFQIAWRLAGKPDQDMMNGFAWLCLIVAYLALTVANLGMNRYAKKYFREGHEKYNLALVGVTLQRHGKFWAKPTDAGDENDITCGCGIFIGTVPTDAPDKLIPLWEEHADNAVKQIIDDVEEKYHAATAGR